MGARFCFRQCIPWFSRHLGHQFLADTEAWQYWHLLATWWKMTNWMFFSYFYSSDDVVYFPFTRLVLHHLLSLKEAQPVLLRDFVLELAEQSRQIFPSLYLARKKDILLSEEHLINRIVVEPMAEFGILKPIHITEDWGGWLHKELQSFSLTSLGISALESLQSAQ